MVPRNIGLMLCKIRGITRIVMSMTQEQLEHILAGVRDKVSYRENPQAKMNKDYKELNGTRFYGEEDVHEEQEWLINVK